MKRNQRDQLKSRLKRIRPENVKVVIPLVDQLIERLATHGFTTEDNSRHGMPFASNELWFERPHSEDAFEYIEIVFADDGELSFGVFCGVRGFDVDNTWHSFANLSRRRFGLWRTSNLGALQIIKSEEKMFVRDWNFFLNSIDEIIRFLETGGAGRELINVQIFEPFAPKAQ